MAIQIIGHIRSPYTIKVVAVLEELKIPYEIVTPENKEALKTPEFLEKNHPFGRTPVLFDDGFRLYESQAIARYLAKKYQGTKTSTIIYPNDVQKAALVEQFISVEASYYYEPLYKLVYQELYIPKFNNGTPDPKIVKESLEEFSKVLDVYEKLLEGKNYLTGDFSLADILHYPYSYYATLCGHEDLFNDPKRPNVARWWKAISEREGWQNYCAKHKASEETK